MEDSPLISCLCVSTQRPRHLKRAIACFLAQTYPHKELVIVSKHFNAEYKQMVDAAQAGNINYYHLEGDEVTLGNLRNYSLELAAGEYFCIWDDDDWHHSGRIAIQLEEALRNSKPASILGYYLLYDSVHEQGYVSSPSFLHGGLLCRKAVIAEEMKYRALAKEEDVTFVKNLFMTNSLFPIVRPSLYIYNYHGSNTGNWDNFSRLFGAANKLPLEISRLIKDVLDDKYSHEEASRLLDAPDVLKEFSCFTRQHLATRK